MFLPDVRISSASKEGDRGRREKATHRATDRTTAGTRRSPAGANRRLMALARIDLRLSSGADRAGTLIGAVRTECLVRIEAISTPHWLLKDQARTAEVGARAGHMLRPRRYRMMKLRRAGSIVWQSIGYLIAMPSSTRLDFSRSMTSWRVSVHSRVLTQYSTFRTV